MRTVILSHQSVHVKKCILLQATCANKTKTQNLLISDTGKRTPKARINSNRFGGFSCIYTVTHHHTLLPETNQVVIETVFNKQVIGVLPRMCQARNYRYFAAGDLR